MKNILSFIAFISFVSLSNAQLQDRQEAIRKENLQKSWVFAMKKLSSTVPAI